MYTNKNKKTIPVKTVIIILILIMVFILGSILYAKNDHKATTTPNKLTGSSSGLNQKIDYAPATPQEVKAADDAKQNSSQKVTQAAPSTKPTDSVTIISAAQDNQSNVIVKTRLDGAGWKNCSLSLTSGSKTIVKSADAIFQPEFSSCAGFSIPTNELTAGQNTLLLSATKNDDTTQVSTSRDVYVTK